MKNELSKNKIKQTTKDRMSKQDGLLPTPPASLQISGGVSLSERLKQIQKLKEQTSKNQANNEEDENDQQEEEEEQGLDSIFVFL